MIAVLAKTDELGGKAIVFGDLPGNQGIIQKDVELKIERSYLLS